MLANTAPMIGVEICMAGWTTRVSRTTNPRIMSSGMIQRQLYKKSRVAIGAVFSLGGTKKYQNEPKTTISKRQTP
eukprot:1069123-Rhodomonas_salina.4